MKAHQVRGRKRQRRLDALQQLLRGIDKIDAGGYRYEALRVLLPYLPDNLLPEALRIAQDTEYRQGEEKAKLLAELSDYVPESLKGEVIQAALTAVRDINDAVNQAYAIRSLIPHLRYQQSPNLLLDVFALILKLEPGWYRNEALAELAPHLSPQMLIEAIENYDVEKTSSQSKDYRAEVITKLVPFLPPEFLTRALAIIRDIQNDALSRADALAGIASYLPPDLRFEVLSELLEAIRSTASTFHIVEVLTKLAPHLPDSLLRNALAIALEIKNDDYVRSQSLIVLASHLSPSLLLETLEKAREIQADGSACASLLKALFPHLPSTLLPEALSITRRIQLNAETWACAEAIAALAPYLSPDLLMEALEIALQIKPDSRAYTHAIAALAPYLPESALHQPLVDAFSAIDEITGDSFQCIDSLSELAPHLPSHLFSEALAVSYRIEEPYLRDSALAALAPHLPSNLFLETLIVARRLHYEEDSRAEALIALLSNSPPEYFTEVQKINRGIAYGRAFNQALAALAPHLPPNLIDEALRVIQAIEDDFSRNQALKTLTPYLQADLPAESSSEAENNSSEIGQVDTSTEAQEVWTEALPDTTDFDPNVVVPRLPEVVAGVARHPEQYIPEPLPDNPSEALAAIREIPYSYYRASALAGLVPDLPSQLLPEALLIAGELEYGSPRAEAIVALAPHLPSELLPDALTIVRETEEADARAQAIVALAPHLPPELLPDALTIIRNTKGADTRAQVMVALAPHLPPELLPNALRVTYSIKDDAELRAFILSLLLSQSPISQRTQILREWLETVEEIHEEAELGLMLALRWLVRWLPTEYVSEVWEQIFATVQRLIDDELVRLLASQASLLPIDLLRDFIQIVLNQASEEDYNRELAEVADSNGLPIGRVWVSHTEAQLLVSKLEDVLASWSSQTEVEPIPRYADFTFYHDERNSLGQKLPSGHTLQAEQWYQLEVAVREKPIGIPTTEQERRPIREPKQQESVTIMVTAEGDGFDIEEPVQTLLLPPRGDSVENAYFRVCPLRQSASRKNLASIHIRTYYKFNLLEVAVVCAEVVSKFDEPSQSQLGLEQPITFKQERLEREYLDFDEVEPREMHVDIKKQDECFLFKFAFYKDTEQKIEFTASIYLPASDLEDALLNIRQIWYDIAMSKTFTEQLQGDEDEFLVNIRKLAKAGCNLWTKLFKHEHGSAMFNIGKYLEEHPLKPGAIVQVSLEKNTVDFVFPWALLYDRKVPRRDYELPDLQGFWGLRYCIEQQLPNRVKDTDKPIRVKDKLKLGFMLWDQFRNAPIHQLMMESFMKQSSNRLEISTPPITDADDCFDLLDECDAHILYFYTHGYTRHRQADIGVGHNFELFENRYKRLKEDDPQRAFWKLFYESIKQENFEPDRSWIELTYGKLYLNELYREIENKLQSQPLVFLNMCESAQITPSLSDSFIHFFLDRGAKGVIGTECPMTIEFAHPFAEKFLGDMLTGEKVGIALLRARRHFMEIKNPLGLAYTLFGSATICFEPASLQLPIATVDIGE